MPRSPDLAILCLRQTIDTTDYFTPYARLRGKYRDPLDDTKMLRQYLVS